MSLGFGIMIIPSLLVAILFIFLSIKFYKNLYSWAIHKNLLKRMLFWLIIVSINALYGAMFALEENNSIISIVSGVVTWVLISAFFSYTMLLPSKRFGKSLFQAYIVKTLLILLGPLHASVTMFIGLLSVASVDMLKRMLRPFLRQLWELGIIPQDLSFVYTYVTVILHGFFVSLIILLLGVCMHWFSKIREKNQNDVKKVTKL